MNNNISFEPVYNKVSDETCYVVWAQAQSQVENRVRGQVSLLIYNRVVDKVISQIRDRVVSQIMGQVNVYD